MWYKWSWHEAHRQLVWNTYGIHMNFEWFELHVKFIRITWQVHKKFLCTTHEYGLWHPRYVLHMNEPPGPSYHTTPMGWDRWCLLWVQGHICVLIHHPSTACMRQWVGWALVQIMACCLCSTKPLIWTNAGLLSNGPWGKNFNEISIKIRSFSWMHLEMLSAKMVVILSRGDELTLLLVCCMQYHVLM